MATWVINMISSAGYVGIVALMFAENIFPPIPSEVIMPLAGYMVAKDEFSFFAVVFAGMMGSVLGALPFYYLGRKLSEERLKTFADKHGRWLTIDRKDIEHAKRWFDKHGGAAILFGRLIPGVRSVISIPAGIARMKLIPFLAYTAVGTTLWAALLTYLGYCLGSNFTVVGEYLDPISWIVLAAIVILYVFRVVRHKTQ